MVESRRWDLSGKRGKASPRPPIQLMQGGIQFAAGDRSSIPRENRFPTCTKRIRDRTVREKESKSPNAIAWHHIESNFTKPKPPTTALSLSSTAKTKEWERNQNREANPNPHPMWWTGEDWVSEGLFIKSTDEGDMDTWHNTLSLMRCD